MALRNRGHDVTLQDVATTAGVSLATASRVLNGSERTVADSYQARVRKAAEDLGYIANMAAQATARGTSAAVALLVADITDPYFAEVASGVARGADEVGLMMTISITERDPQRELDLVRALKGQRPQGLILASSRRAGEGRPAFVAELEACARRGSRIVALGEGGGIVRGLQVANKCGAQELGIAVAALGYRSALIVGAMKGLVTSDDRVAGFTEGFGLGGGAVRAVMHGGFDRAAGERDMTVALRDGVDIGTLVFGINDVVAIGALAAIRQAGLEPGRDIAVCGFDDIPTSRDVTPALTTYRLPLGELGYQALQATIHQDWQEPAPLGGQVIIRGSTPPR